ncbi:MAG: hypothetical protein PG981_000669 [Wolbachia endosymbiont of Ctenocephalides orientis wCori]|nr:MAG: hypothetical protein PG981_000669 [Wolbachia endosymbiont of Ctenocephalides orientis wCori]
MITTILIGYALDKVNQNSKKIGENNYKASIINIEEKQTILYLSEESSSEGEVYVKLKKKYPDGCIVKSKSGEKIVTLKYIPEEGNNGHKYKVIEYQNTSNSDTSNPEMTKEDFKEDFFERNKTQRRDVSIYSISPATLSNIVINPHSQKKI